MIILMGLAGSGKSTQSQLLAAHLHCPWISTGGLLREHMDTDTQAGMLQGKMVIDDKTIAVLEEEFQRINASSSECILDGSPRTMHQAEWLTAQAADKKIFITAIIHLQVSKKTAERRLLARQRPDDYISAIAERFKEYDTSILPILNLIKDRGYKIHEIDAEKEVEEVQSEILAALGASK